MKLQEIRRTLRKLGSRRRAAVLRRFFKTGAGEYGEGDVFLGIRVPVLRKLAGSLQSTRLGDIERLLQSAVHEERLLALVVLVKRFSKGSQAEQRKIYRLYFKDSQFVNSWDLVDVSAPGIVGCFLEKREKEPLNRLAESSNLWERRIAVMATFHFIKQGKLTETFRIARILLDDEEDLIHKAVGWMLREAGKRSMRAEEKFLRQHCRRMPRTMLRYAIEKFPAARRRKYMAGTV